MKSRKAITADQCIDAIKTAGSVDLAGPLLSCSPSLIRSRLHEARIDIRTLEPVKPLVYAPGEELEIRRGLIRRAIELGIWHIDDAGDVQPYYRGDPWRGGGPNLLTRKST